MPRYNLNDLHAFTVVAEQGSFTRAAAKLGLSQSALSTVVSRLEAQLGVRLLTRTTRSVSPTTAGEGLLASLGTKLEDIEADLAAVSDQKDRPSGTIRITCVDSAAEHILLPKLAPLLERYPDIKVELVIDYGLTDIAAERFTAGVRSGESVEKDMIAVRIGPDERLVVAATPAYFKKHPVPKTPRELTEHNCINLRLPTHGGLYAWEFEKDGEPVRVRVDGQWTFNSSRPILQATLAGAGIGFVSEEFSRPYIESGELIQVLDEWCPSYPGFHLYYPSRRQMGAAFELVVDALRYRGPARR